MIEKKPKYYQKPDPEKEWEGAKTLGEVIVKLIREKKTESEEFKTILRVFGRDRVRQLYKETIQKERVKYGKE